MGPDPLDIPGLLSRKECDVLARVAHRSGATRALDVGHYHGRSTAVLLSSLPIGAYFTTVDHHQGDYYAVEPVNHDEFIANIQPFWNGGPVRAMKSVDKDMLAVDYTVDAPHDFVFYDADHHEQPIRD